MLIIIYYRKKNWKKVIHQKRKENFVTELEPQLGVQSDPILAQRILHLQIVHWQVKAQEGCFEIAIVLVLRLDCRMVEAVHEGGQEMAEDPATAHLLEGIS
jgi:hypothetical protein